MDEPKPLDSFFKEKLFRIPDYQRGYAWGREQLDAFWEDLINLPDGRSHYTGVLTLKEIPSADVQKDDKEFWLVDDHSYKLYHIVDGQQRLTTFTLFLQAFIELLRSLPENEGQVDEAIYLTDTLSIAAVESKFLGRVVEDAHRPPGRIVAGDAVAEAEVVEPEPCIDDRVGGVLGGLVRPFERQQIVMGVVPGDRGHRQGK